MFCYCDIAGQVRGKGFPARDLKARLASGVGWTPTNIMITAFGPIADTPWGPRGDLILLPDPNAEARVEFGDGLPGEHFFLGDVLETDGRPWDCCPRSFLKRALLDLEREFGLRLIASFEHEFCYSGVEERPNSSYALDSVRRLGAFPELFLYALDAAGLAPDSFLPEYAPRQYEVTCRAAEGVRAADRAAILRELARATAFRLGHRATFAPMMTPGGVGNGVHIHFSLRDLEDRPVSHDPEALHGLGERIGRFAAGVLRHMPALCALTAPAVVSYMRLVPNRWSAVYNNLGVRDREAGVRICPVSDIGGTPVAAQYNLEYRAADAAANPYLALGAIVRAGLQGLRDELPAPQPTEADPGSFADDDRRRRGIVRLPQSLDEALDALQADAVARDFFPPALLDAYLRHKRHEIAQMRDLSPEEQCALYAQAY
jgi:glutamine synthetase